VAIVSTTLASCGSAAPVPAWAGRGDGTRVLLVGPDAPLEDVTKALQYGASGWVAKDASAGELLRAVRTVARGDVHLPPGLLSAVVRVLAETGQPRSVRDALAGLTSREHEVLGCMVDGLKRDEIAARLFLSPNTVRTHMQNVLRKLDVHSSLAAAAYARRYGVTGVGRSSNHLASAP
jgi:DNA-binding NarL/FixJ family response regulator